MYFKSLLFVLAFSICVLGCQHPEAYIIASDQAFELAPKADKNVETLCLNFYNQISEHTAELVAAGQMEESEREKVLATIKDQVVETRRQVLYLTTYTKLAYQDAHSSTLEVNNFTDILKATNESIPEVKKLISQFK